MINYSEKQLEQILSVGDNEQYIYMPNEIFEDLLEIDVLQKNRSAAHRAYAYAYVYLTYYLYRYAKYGGIFEYSEEEFKKILNRSPIDKKVNYLTKAGGDLEKLGYIKKTSDFPIAYIYYDSFGYSYDYILYDPTDKKEVVFIMFSEYEWQENRRNKRINYPIKGLEERIVSIQGEEECVNGVFYEVEKTHLVSVKTLLYCLSREDLGVEAFFLYSYIKMMTQIHKHGWNCPKNRLIERIGLTEHSIKRCLRVLEEYNMITNSHQDFVYDLDPGKQLPANRYKAKVFEQFIKKGEPKNKIRVRRVYSQEAYEQEYGKIGAIEVTGINDDEEFPYSD